MQTSRLPQWAIFELTYRLEEIQNITFAWNAHKNPVGKLVINVFFPNNEHEKGSIQMQADFLAKATLTNHHISIPFRDCVTT